MLQLQSPKEIRKRARSHKNLINPQSHVQKKYFSLMLVPSYSSGKTRSIRIPYTAFYILFAIIFTVGAIMMGLHLRAQSLRQAAQYAEQHLEQVQEAYISLHEMTEEERRRLTEDSINLRSALTQERIRGEQEQQQQRLTYLETLEAIQEYVEGLEEQLNQFEVYRQEILDKLSSNAHIPPVRNMLNEMYQSQVHLLAKLEDLADYSAHRREGNQSNMMFMSAQPAASSSETAAGNLFSYIAALELTLETKKELYSMLNSQVSGMVRYINNYPTTRPVHGRLSSGFGWRRNPMGGSGSQMHQGVDISAPRGTSIFATGGGTVIFSGWSTGGYGNKVIIDHGLGIQTLYAHNSANLVRVGDTVQRGDVIARVGSTGRSTGPHVHYEVIVNGAPVNPDRFFLEEG
jgi:hypothetical protein